MSQSMSISRQGAAPQQQGQHQASTSRTHTRSQSSPYFEQTRTFISPNQNDNSEVPRSSQQAVTCSTSVSAVRKSVPAKLQRHIRSAAAGPRPRPPLITTDIKIESEPAATLPTSLFSTSIPIKFDLSPPESPIISSDKDKWNFMPSFKTDPGLPSRSPSPSRLSTWFQGESAPISFGLVQSPTKEESNPFQAGAMLPEPVAEPPRINKANAFFSSFFTGRTTTTVAVPEDAHGDEFFNMDIKRSLQPQGQIELFTPTSFKNYQHNAEAVLARMQTAYRRRVLAIQDVKSEQEAQEEELEESQTRAHHLKSQLDTLSCRVDEQNQEMQRLVKELQEERRLRKDEAERNKTIRLVDDHKPFDGRSRSRTSLGSIDSTPSMLSDAESCQSDPVDHVRYAQSNASSPYTPRSDAWPQDLQYQLPVSQKLMGQMRVQEDLEIVQENTELKTRVVHLEKELDSCLEILKSIGL